MSDTRDLYKLVRDLEQNYDENDIRLHDRVDLELNEHFVIETGVVGFTEDGVILHLDEDGLQYLEFNNILLEDEMSEKMKMGSSSDASASGSYLMGESWDDEGTVDPREIEDMIKHRLMSNHFREDVGDVIGKFGPVRIMNAIQDYASSIHWPKGQGINSKDPWHWAARVVRDLEKGYYDDADSVPVRKEIKIRLPEWVSESKELAEIKRLATGQGSEDLDEGWKGWALGGAALLAAILGGNELEYRHALKTDPQLAKLVTYLEIAQKKGDDAKVEELKDRIQKTYDHLEVTGGEVMGADGNPVDPVYEGASYFVVYVDGRGKVKSPSREKAEEAAKFLRTKLPKGSKIEIKSEVHESKSEYDAWRSLGKPKEKPSVDPRFGADELRLEPSDDEKESHGGDPRNYTGRHFNKRVRDLEEDPDWNKIAGALGGRDPDAVPLPKAEKGGTGPVMSFPNIYKYVVKHIKNSSIRLTDDPPGEIDDALKKLKIKITGKKRQDLINRIIQQMEDDGKINDLYDDPIYEGDIEEAKYQGREVPLGKPMQGDVKKSKVYVKKPNGKVVKVNFGDKNMRIKKNSPGHRKSFRARHHCENPGPRWKARYWSCRAW